MRFRRIFNRTPLRYLISETAEENRLTVGDITGPRKFPEFVRARKIVIRRAVRDGYTVSEIARALNKHHTTIMAAKKSMGI